MLRETTILASTLLAWVLGSVMAQAQESSWPATLPASQPTTLPVAPPATQPISPARPGQLLQRQGDEIMVCGQLFHTGGARVVLWLDPGGYDAYRVERRFVPFEQSAWAPTTQASSAIKEPNRYNLRESLLTPAQIERVRGGGWDLELLKEKVDQFVLHYDACGTSRQCFEVLHDDRGLSIHFMIDLDGTIYQTLDLKERAWHATVSNSRSIGVEIANVGAYTVGEPDPFAKWYAKDSDGRWRITLPQKLGDGGILTPGFVGRPARNKVITGSIQGKRRRQFDLTDQQYDALIKLTATLCTIFPKIACDYPRDDEGRLIPRKLSDEKLATFGGVLGHYHIQSDKIDPGPAFQWDRLILGAQAMMKGNDE